MKKKIKISKIREILEKHVDSFGVIVPEDFDKLEKELEEYMKTLWTQIGYEWDGKKFIKYESRTP